MRTPMISIPLVGAQLLGLVLLGLLGASAATAAPAPAARAGAPAQRGDAGAAPAPDADVERGELDAIDAELAEPRRAVHGPGIGAVIAAAYAAAGLDHDPQDSWLRRARLAGLVPWVTVRTTRDTSWQDDSSDIGHSTSLELRATWRLDRLLFDGRELQVAAVDSARHRERRRLASRVIRAYFAWRRAARIATDDERVATRIAETVAELDALTDGWFSVQLAPPRGGVPPGSEKP
ncbi:MAG TPA: hypothetical protein VHT91_25555 [Kofleriaceae bacterium]|jgi:hypothetical protein|nr:hypothetical protein [Kofleriaceae bacterium]